MFWTGIAVGAFCTFCGVLVGIPLGFMLRGVLDRYELPGGASDPLRSPGAGLAYRRRWRRSERSDPYCAADVVFRRPFRPETNTFQRDGGATVHMSNDGHE